MKFGQELKFINDKNLLMIDFNNRMLLLVVHVGFKGGNIAEKYIFYVMFFFCNDCYLHSLHELFKQFNCLYQYIYIFLLIYFIVSARFWYNVVFRFNKATHLSYLAIIGLIKYAFLNLQYFFLSFFVKVKINCLPYTW